MELKVGDLKGRWFNEWSLVPQRQVKVKEKQILQIFIMEARLFTIC